MADTVTNKTIQDGPRIFVSSFNIIPNNIILN